MQQVALDLFLLGNTYGLCGLFLLLFWHILEVIKRGDIMPAGQPKKFSNGKRLIELFRAFCDEIVEHEFTRVPNQTNFCKWLEKNYSSVDRKTIYTSLNKYFPSIKKDFEQIQSDIIAEGGMLGHYQPTMSIFALKNWCKWTDKQEVDVSTIDDNTRSEVERLVAEARKSENDEE